MKILYYTHSYFLDCDLPLIRSLRNEGNDVYFLMEIVPYQLKMTLLDLEMQINRVGMIPLSSYKEFESFSLYLDMNKSFILNRPCKVYDRRNFKMRRQLYKWLKTLNPDIIHCTDFIDWPDFGLYWYRNRIVQVVHDPFPHTGEQTLKKRVLRYFAYNLLKSFVILNKSQVEEFAIRNKIEKSHIYTNKLGEYECINMFSSPRKKSGKKMLLFYGRISPYKGVNYLLEACEIAHRDHDFEVVIAGAGDFNFDISGYKTSDYINFLNRYITMQELYSLLDSCSVVVCPYTDATQSGVVMTAYAMKKPVIATNVGGLPEMVISEKTGVIVPPRDVRALAEAISRCIVEESMLDSFRKNIENMYFNNGTHSWESIAKKYMDVYQHTLKA